MIRIRSKWKTIALLMVVSVCLIVSSFPIDAAVPLKTSAKSVIHEVFPGETLWSISKRYGVPIESLKRLNELSVTSIVPGQALIIRDKVVVRKGESLWNIAIRHGTTRTSAQHNRMRAPSHVRTGTKIRIPQPRRVPIVTGAYFVPTNPKTQEVLLQRYRPLISRVGIFEYHANWNGNRSSVACPQTPLFISS